MNDLTPQQRKETLIHNLEEAREKMRTVLTKVSVNQEIYPTWTIRHILAHLSGWDEACIASLDSYLNGKEIVPVASRGADFYNAQSVETRIEMDFDRIHREFEVTREQFKALIQRVPAEKLDDAIMMPWAAQAPLHVLITTFTDHEADHAAEIIGIVSKIDEERAAQAAKPVTDDPVPGAPSA